MYNKCTCSGSGPGDKGYHFSSDGHSHNEEIMCVSNDRALQREDYWYIDGFVLFIREV